MSTSSERKPKFRAGADPHRQKHTTKTGNRGAQHRGSQPSAERTSLDLQSTEKDYLEAVNGSGTDFVVTPSEVLAPLTPARQQAEDWDRRIDKIATNVLDQTLEMARLLAKIKETEAFRELGFANWEAYLDSKRQGRTTLSYLLKLGQAGDLSWVVPRAISPTILTTYAEKVTPAQIPKLIEGTIDQVEGRTVKEAREVIVGYIAAHADEFPKSRRSTTPKPARIIDWRGKFIAELDAAYERQIREDNLSGSVERASAYIEAIKAFIERVESERAAA